MTLPDTYRIGQRTASQGGRHSRPGGRQADRRDPFGLDILDTPALGVSCSPTGQPSRWGGADPMAAEKTAADARARRKRIIRVIQALISVVVAAAMFGLVIPKIANYSSVWKTITSLTWLELTSLVIATIFNLFTYWWQMMAAMPGLTLAQAAVNNQSSTTIANIVPGGGVIALGLT